MSGRSGRIHESTSTCGGMGGRIPVAGGGVGDANGLGGPATNAVLFVADSMQLYPGENVPAG